jgi:hypothetical protein
MNATPSHMWGPHQPRIIPSKDFQKAREFHHHERVSVQRPIFFTTYVTTTPEPPKTLTSRHSNFGEIVNSTLPHSGRRDEQSVFAAVPKPSANLLAELMIA